MKLRRGTKRTLLTSTNLFFVFLILKLTNVIAWKWVWVLAPLWIPIVIYILFMIFIIFILKKHLKNHIY